MPNSLVYLERHRDVLLSDLEGLEPAALDWRPYPDSFPISRSLLHIAAFELVVAAAADSESRPDRLRALGARAVPGLESSSPQAGMPLAGYLELLAAVRAESLCRLGTAGSGEEGIPDLRPAVRACGVAESRVEGVAASLARDLRPGREMPFDPVRAIAEHESYHRGQITLMKYLWKRRTGVSG